MLAPISSTRAASLLLRRQCRGLAATATRQLTTPPSRIARAHKSTLSVAIRGTGTGLAQTITTAEPYTINMDTYKSLGGKETAPSPLSYSLASLSGCTQVTGVLVARDHGIKTGRWEVDVKGALDSDVLVKGAKEGHGNWESVEVVVRVETDLGEGQADKDRFEVFRRETERRCPLSQLFIRSGVKWTNEWVNVTTVA